MLKIGTEVRIGNTLKAHVKEATGKTRHASGYCAHTVIAATSDEPRNARTGTANRSVPMTLGLLVGGAISSANQPRTPKIKRFKPKYPTALKSTVPSGNSPRRRRKTAR
jgi:hypothetical protein